MPADRLFACLLAVSALAGCASRPFNLERAVDRSIIIVTC